jgi:hypothetical protein
MAQLSHLDLLLCNDSLFTRRWHHFNATPSSATESSVSGTGCFRLRGSSSSSSTQLSSVFRQRSILLRHFHRRTYVHAVPIPTSTGPSSTGDNSNHSASRIQPNCAFACSPPARPPGSARSFVRPFQSADPIAASQLQQFAGRRPTSRRGPVAVLPLVTTK